MACGAMMWISKPSAGEAFLLDALATVVIAAKEMAMMAIMIILCVDMETLL
jgi:hypothetical protein